MFFYSHLYSRFGLPFLSYFYFKHLSRSAMQYGSFDFYFGQSFRLYIHQFSGLVFSFGYLFQATLDIFGFIFFGGYSLYQSRLSRSFSTCTILVPSIVSDLYLIYYAILFQELSLTVALENLRILIHSEGIDSITIWWHIVLLETNVSQHDILLGVSLPISTIVHRHLLIQQLQFFLDIKHIRHFLICLWMMPF